MFFSNGFDIAWTKTTGPTTAVHERNSLLIRFLVADLTSFPMPTVAAFTGHAAAAGLLLSLSHDYVLMRRARGVAYMSELDLGVTLPDYFAAAGLRDTVLRAGEAVKLGIVDSAHDSRESTVEAAVRLGEQLAGRM